MCHTHTHTHVLGALGEELPACLPASPRVASAHIIIHLLAIPAFLFPLAPALCGPAPEAGWLAACYSALLRRSDLNSKSPSSHNLEHTPRLRSRLSLSLFSPPPFLCLPLCGVPSPHLRQRGGGMASGRLCLLAWGHCCTSAGLAWRSMDGLKRKHRVWCVCSAV